MARVSRLGYLVFEVSDLAAWESFAVDGLGLMVGERESGGALLLRMDEQAQRFRLEPGPADDLLYAGFELDSESELEALAEKLSSAGFAVSTCSEQEANSRRVGRLLRTEDPNGVGIELFLAPSQADTPFASDQVPSGFVTGEQGLGHIVVNARDAKASEHFYMELLGMRLSDRIDMEVAPDFTIETSFFHANARHHTLAFAQIELPKKMHHFMIEAREMDAVGRGYDRVRDAGIRIMSALGRHTNDQMFSFYARTPSRFEVEFGWGRIEIDDSTWEVARYDRGSLWGHRRPERPREGA